MMAKRVLDVGNCAFDHVAICALLKGGFAADVVQTHGRDDTLAALRRDSFDLVLVNRRLARGGGNGLDIIREMKNTPELAATPVMLITNYAEHQQAAVAAGAESGFGKRELDDRATHDKLKQFLA
jgi:CheY-like chemotaxis protein